MILTADDGVGTFSGRYVVVTTNQDPVEDYELQLSEIEVYSGGGGVEVPINYAFAADAFTNGTIWSASWLPSVLTDGVANIIHGDGPGGTAGVAEDEGFYYEINLGQEIELAEVHIVPRQDGCCPNACQTTKSQFTVTTMVAPDQQFGVASTATTFPFPTRAIPTSLLRTAIPMVVLLGNGSESPAWISKTTSTMDLSTIDCNYLKSKSMATPGPDW